MLVSSPPWLALNNDLLSADNCLDVLLSTNLSCVLATHLMELLGSHVDETAQDSTIFLTDRTLWPVMVNR